MDAREFFPASRGIAPTTDVAGFLAAVRLPLIEPFTSDNPLLTDLPGMPPYPEPHPVADAAAGSWVSDGPGFTAGGLGGAAGGSAAGELGGAAGASRVSVAQGAYDGAIAALEQIRRLEGAVAACKTELVAKVMGASAVEAAGWELDAWQSGVASSSVRRNIAVVLGIPESSATLLAEQAAALTGPRSATWRGLHHGSVSWSQTATIISEIETLAECEGIDAQALNSFESRLLGMAPGTTASVFRNKARKLRESLFPDSISTRTRQAFARRKLSNEPGKDNMSWLTLHLPTITANAVYDHCTQLARRHKTSAGEATPAAGQSESASAGCSGSGSVGGTAVSGSTPAGEYRSMDQLRADIAALLLLGMELPNSAVKPITNSAPAAPNPIANFMAHVAPSPATVEPNPALAAPNPAADPSATPMAPAAGRVSIAPDETRGLPPAPWEQASAPPSVVQAKPVEAPYVEDPYQEYLQQLEHLRNGGTITGPPLPAATVIVTVPVLGLLKLTDEPASMVGPQGGPFPMDLARELLLNSTGFLRVLTDPMTGRPLPLEPERYTLREIEKTVLRTIMGSCYVPNCTNPVVDTDFDHLTPYNLGGPSSTENLRPACKKHHHHKHFKDDKNKKGQPRRYNEPDRTTVQLRGWTPQPMPDGQTGWITPTGQFQPPATQESAPPQYPQTVKNYLTPPPPNTIDFISAAEQRITEYLQQHRLAS